MCSARPAFFFFGPWHITECLVTNGTMIFSTASLDLATGCLICADASSLLQWMHQMPSAATKTIKLARYRNRMAGRHLGGGRVKEIVAIGERRCNGDGLLTPSASEGIAVKRQIRKTLAGAMPSPRWRS